MNFLALHQQMVTLLHLNFKDKQVENYNVFSSSEGIKCMLGNQHFFLDNVHPHLVCVENFFVIDSASSDLTDPPSNRSPTPTLISSHHD